MSQILVVETSPQRFQSFSNKLSKEIVDKLQAKNPRMSLKIRDLVTNPPPYLTTLEFGSFSDEAIEEVFNSDVIILSIATHNYSIPAVLKAWIDQIVRAGKTFSYSEAGPQGLVSNKKVYLSIASGGVHTKDSPDYIEAYLKTILGFIGISDVVSFRVEGLAIPGIKETALEEALKLVHREK